MRIAGKRVERPPHARRVRLGPRIHRFEPVAVPLDPVARASALARSAGPLRRVVCALAGRFVEARAWDALGYARARDYAAEHLGQSASWLHQHARVDAALAALPALEAALASGALAWSKVRLLAGVATPEDVPRWIAFARRLSVRQLEREVRAVDRGAQELDDDRGDAPDREGVELRCAPLVNGKWWHTRQTAQRVAGEKLPAWGCVEAVSAEVLSTLPAEPDEEEEVGPPPAAPLRSAAREAREKALSGDSPGDPGEGETQAPGALVPLPASLAPLVAGLAEADAAELHARLQAAARELQQLGARLGPDLLRIARGRLFRALGHDSLADFARERLDLSPRKASALLRLERAALRSAALERAYRSGGLSWVRAHALVPLVYLPGSGPALARWVERAKRITVRLLEEDVDRAVVLADLDPAGFDRTGGLPEAGAEEAADSQTCAQPRDSAGTPARPDETARVWFGAPREIARLFRVALCRVRRTIERRTGRLPTEGEAFDAMLDHALQAWAAPNPRIPKAQRALERDGWRCTVPGCTSYRNLQVHHIVFRSHGGSDELENLTTLCAFHHHRGVHAGRVRCAGRAPRALRFELGLRPGRSPLFVYEGETMASPTGFEPVSPP